MASAHSSASIHRDDQSVLHGLEDSPLHLSASMGDAVRVRHRLAAGDDVNALCCVDANGEASAVTSLFCAAGMGHSKVVSILLKAVANPSAVNPGDGTSALHVAACCGSMEVITMLLRAGAVVDWTDHQNNTALSGAAAGGHDKVVEALLAAKAKVNIANYNGGTPLIASARHGHEKCVRLLLQAGADLCKIEHKHGLTALHWGAIGGSLAVVRTLLGGGADVHRRANDGISVLHAAAQHGSADVIAAFSDAGADIDAVDSAGWTALRHAAILGHDNVVQALISACATLDLADGVGITPLMAAAQAGEESCVRLLLKAGADISKVGGVQEFTPLYAAASNGQDVVVRTLLSWGARVNNSDVGGRTAFNEAVNEGYPATVKLLIDAGWDANMRDGNNATVLMCASDLPTAKVLLEAGVSATAIDDFGNTVLHHLGIQGGNTAVICSIFKAGANPTLLNKAGLTAAQVARAEGHNDAAKLLDMLAAKYTQTEKSVAEANIKPPAAAPSELNVKMSSCVMEDASSELTVGLVEGSEYKEEEQKQKVLQPCLNCQTLTHRRCARCRTAYVCSRDCQVATLAEHRVECMKIYEGRERAKAERKAAKRQEECG